MAFINVKRKTIKLPNGIKINFNKDIIQKRKWKQKM